MFVRTSDGITFVVLDGSFGIECGDALHRTVLDLLEEGQRAFIVDLLRVWRIDAAAVGQLARAFTTVRTSGGELAVVVDSEQIRELLTVTRLTTIVPTFPSTAEAVARFALVP